MLFFPDLTFSLKKIVCTFPICPYIYLPTSIDGNRGTPLSTEYSGNHADQDKVKSENGHLNPTELYFDLYFSFILVFKEYQHKYVKDGYKVYIFQLSEIRKRDTL